MARTDFLQHGFAARGQICDLCIYSKITQ